MVPLDATTPAFTHADHSPLHVTAPTYIFNEVCDFQNGIKCNIMLHPIFDNDQQYDSWYCETHAIASIHGTEAVFDPHYSYSETLQAYYG